MDFGEASFAEVSKVFVGVSNGSSNVPANTVLMTFQCTVDEGASGDLTIGMLVLDDDVFDGELNNIPHTESVDTVTVGGGAPVPPPAAASVDFTVKADAATANPGDTITFEVSVAPVNNLGGIVFTLNIPEGLSFVTGSSSVNAALKGSLNFGEASFAESTKVFVGVSNDFSNIAADTVLMTFKCTVDAAASGSKTVTLDVVADDVFDADLNNIPFTVTDATVSVEAAGCTHDWAAADCDTPKTCKLCGETEGAALGHDWEAADCDTAKTCKVCGATEGAALGHSWDNASCTSPKTCTVCGLTEGAAAGHRWDFATCTEPETCYICGATTGEPNGHAFKPATCTSPKTCVDCGITEGEPNGHSWDNASCTSPKTCSVCGKTEGAAAGHDWAAADCDSPKTCKVCGATEGAALGHDWEAADCDTPKTCKVCGLTEGEPNGHDWADPDCQNPKTCTACGATEGEKGDHVDNDGDGKCDVCGYEETPATGDESVMGFVVILMIAAVCGAVVVCNKKKFIV